MQVVQRHIAEISKTNRSAVSNGSRLLDGVDGRSATARRFRDICRSYEREIGGEISEVERDLIKQAAGLTLRAEQLQAAIVRGEDIDNDQLIRISSTSKRVLEAINAKAQKRKTPPAAGNDLKSYLASRSAGQAA